MTGVESRYFLRINGHPLGGTDNDSGNAIALDASGDAYIAGGTSSSDFPTTTGAFQTTYGGGNLDAFVFELNSNGTALVYSTYLGGSNDDVAVGIALDSSDNAYIVGSTGSSPFPTLNPIQPNLNGASNGFVTKLNFSGSALVYSTYLGGNDDFAAAVALDSSGNAYVTGSTQNTTFPTTPGAFQTTCGSCGSNPALDNAFVTVINAAGSGYVYSTFLGGNNNDQGRLIRRHSRKVCGPGIPRYVNIGARTIDRDGAEGTDPGRSAWGGNNDAFVSEINSAGSQLIFSTYLGGSKNENTQAASTPLPPLLTRSWPSTRRQPSPSRPRR